MTKSIQSQQLTDSLVDVSATTPEAILSAARNFAQIANSIGFRAVVWHDISSKNGPEDCDGASLNETAFDWDDRCDKWWDRPQIALASPIALACRYESEPFWANARGVYELNTRSKQIVKAMPKMFADTDEFASIIIVPVHLAFGQIGLTCFMPHDKEKSDLSLEFTEHSHLLTLLSHRFLKTYNQTKDTRREIPQDCLLTRRQVQCLQWASQGKTDMETGMILSLSHAAVRYHLQCAVERLGCVNRTQAVFRAGQLGYVGAI